MSDKGIGTIKVVQKPESQYFRCTWTIEKLKYIRSRYMAPLSIQHGIQSPDIKTTIGGNEYIWNLAITFWINNAVVLKLKKCHTNIDVKLNCSVIEATGRVQINKGEVEHTFITKSLLNTINIFDFLYDYDNYDSCKASEDKTDIVCEITYKSDDINKLQAISNDDSSLSFDLKLLLHNEKFSDLTIVVEQQEFRVHKAILASRSPVFLAMLESDMAEKRNNKVDIADIDCETLKHMLLYVYTGKVEKLESFELASKLLGPADKYALDALKNVCAKILAETLTVENVVKSLVMAELYRVSELKEKALDFMGKHFRAVAKTKEFESLLKPNSVLFGNF